MAFRRTFAAVADAAIIAALALIAFRTGLALSGCRDLSACPRLTPYILAAIVILTGLYLGLAQALWRRTPAQRVFGVDAPPEKDEDL